MSYPAHRLKDVCTGHSCFPPRKVIQSAAGPLPPPGSSGPVYYNNKGAVRKADMYAVHGCDGSHSGAVAKGSPTVYVHNRQAARVNDPVSCGSYAMTGSTNVFIGDGE